MSEYPLVTEFGETILNDGQLIRHIREKCGDEIARSLEDRLCGEIYKDTMDKIKSAFKILDAIDFTDIGMDIQRASDLLESVVYEKK